jgi:hypothetical protein
LRLEAGGVARLRLVVLDIALCGAAAGCRARKLAPPGTSPASGGSSRDTLAVGGIARSLGRVSRPGVYPAQPAPAASSTPWASTKRKKSRPSPRWRSAFVSAWWRRGESNPRPKTLTPGYYVRFRSFDSRPRGPRPAGFPPGHPGLGFARPPPGREPGAIPLESTPFRLHGHSAVGRTRLKPRKRSYSRWRLLVPAFNEVRGASARNPGASTSPSKPVRPHDTSFYHFARPGGIRLCPPGSIPPLRSRQILERHRKAGLLRTGRHPSAQENYVFEKYGRPPWPAGGSPTRHYENVTGRSKITRTHTPTGVPRRLFDRERDPTRMKDNPAFPGASPYAACRAMPERRR